MIGTIRAKLQYYAANRNPSNVEGPKTTEKHQQHIK